MAYAPRKRNYRIKWKILLPLLLLFSLVVYAGVSVFLEEKETKESYTVCGFTPEKTAEVLHKKSADVMTVNDYVYYGESLGLYEKSYSPLNKDTLSGKSIILRNVCDNNEITMTMGDSVDQKINLQEIKDGFYEVNVMDNLVKKRVVFQNPVEQNTFTTVARDDVVHRVSIVANRSLLKDQSIQMDQNYMFLNVTSEKPSSDKIDVLIDPYGMNIDVQNVPDKGNEDNGLVENDEMFEAAELMKKELESYGLRVEITKKNKDDVIATYGKDGRLGIGYQKEAKYYMFLRFNGNVANPSAKGMEIWHSSYTSPTLARAIMYHMKEDGVIKPSNLYYDNYEWMGVVSSNLITGRLDQQLIYDINLQLRESGGKATQTGRYSETSKAANEIFANYNGMQGLEIDFGYITNKEDAMQWKKNKEAIVASCAKAFVKGINVIK